MKETTDWVKKRAVATRAAQDAVQADWVYPDKSLAAWDADLAALQVLEDAEVLAEAQLNGARGALHGATDNLHRRIVQGVTMLKAKVKGEVALAPLVANLNADGDTLDEMAAEALALAAAWQQIDPNWKPTPLNTLPALSAKITECRDLEKDVAGKKTVFRVAARATDVKTAALEDDNVSWYGSALTVFAAGTAHGDMIRGTIPTTYEPPAAQPAATGTTTGGTTPAA